MILGPERKEAQVEVSMTDTRILGINAPVREKVERLKEHQGDIDEWRNDFVSLDRGLIVAKTTHPYDTRRCPSKQ